jgi:tRNA A37 threonylcarbamoyltransferase TsaD
MCTSVVEVCSAEGAGKSEGGWFPVTSAVVSYDHPHHALLEDAITIDFVNPGLGPGARAAVEITLESAKALAAALGRAIAGAEEMEGRRGL